MSNGLIIAPGGGAPGIPQPVFGSGSAISPAPPINITGSPIIPPPPIGEGGGPPPLFPPPTPPPIGEVPIGPLVGPAIAAAGVPPSLAGVVQPQFATGSKTAPLPSAYFPVFTTTFPVPTIVFVNQLMIGAAVPPQTPSTQNIILDGWGLFVPPGAPTTPGGDGRLPRLIEEAAFAAAAQEDEPRRRRRKSV